MKISSFNSLHIDDSFTHQKTNKNIHFQENNLTNYNHKNQFMNSKSNSRNNSPEVQHSWSNSNYNEKKINQSVNIYPYQLTNQNDLNYMYQMSNQNSNKNYTQENKVFNRLYTRNNPNLNFSKNLGQKNNLNVRDQPPIDRKNRSKDSRVNSAQKNNQFSFKNKKETELQLDYNITPKRNENASVGRSRINNYFD